MQHTMQSTADTSKNLRLSERSEIDCTVTEGHTHYNGRQFYIEFGPKYRSNERTDPECTKLAEIPELENQDIGNEKIRKEASVKSRNVHVETPRCVVC